MRCHHGLAVCLAVLVAAGSAQALPLMEADVVSGVTEAWTPVAFKQVYTTTPVVFTLTGEANTYPSIVRIRNVTTMGFEIAQKEAPNFKNSNADASDGATTPDDVAYFAIEPGSHTICDIQIDVGSLSTTAFRAKSGGGQSWETITFGPFAADPALLLNIQTMNNTDPADGNQEDPTLPLLATTVNKGSVDGDSAQIALERAEATGTGSGDIVNEEIIGWLAATPNATAGFVPSDGTGTPVLLETLVTGDLINGWNQDGPDGELFTWASAFTAAPLAVGSDMSRDGADGGWLRQRSLTASQIGLVIDEDQFGDTERDHADELAGILAVSRPFVHVPEPATLALLGAGLLALARRRRRA